MAKSKGLRRPLRSLIVIACVLASLSLLAVSLLGFLPGRGYCIDQLSQLRLLYLVALIPVLIGALTFRSRVVASIAALTAIANGAACMPLYIPAPATQQSANMTVIAANIWGAHNQHYDRFVQLIKSNNPDVICIEEVTPQWMKELRSRLPEYRYSFDEGLSGGSAIFSRVPISQIIPPEGKDVRRYGVRGEATVSGHKIMLIAEHPPSPHNRRNWRKRNQEFNRLARDVSDSKTPVVVAGDFNSTPWSWYFQRLVNRSKLQDSELGNGVQPSWSTRMPLALVPIDHCLHSSDLKTVKREIGPNIGSDHLPLIVRLAVR